MILEHVKDAIYVKQPTDGCMALQLEEVMLDKDAPTRSYVYEQGMTDVLYKVHHRLGVLMYCCVYSLTRVAICQWSSLFIPVKSGR